MITAINDSKLPKKIESFRLFEANSFGNLRQIRSVICAKFIRLFEANSFGESWKQVVLNVFPA